MKLKRRLSRGGWVVACGLAVPAGAQSLADVELDYSLDIGSDLDLADPITPANNFADAGDVYLEPFGPFGGPIKDDTGTVGPASGFPFAGSVVGFETGTAAQQPTSPAPPLAPGFTVGGAGGVPSPLGVRFAYNNAFDLDASDQLEYLLPAYEIDPERGFEEPGFTSPLILPFDHGTQASVGLTFEPNRLIVSFDDDLAPGWLSGDVPTTAPPNHGGSAERDEVLAADGTLLGGFTGPYGIRDEESLGLAENPDPTPDGEVQQHFDDDVDALDTQRQPFHYFSVDHEANYAGYLGSPAFADPGSIYVTDLFAAGANQAKVLDDVVNLGLTPDTDVDAFEFASVSRDTFRQLFNYDPVVSGGPVGDVLIGLFSVDDNDPDNDDPAGTIDDIHGDESGGFLPSGVYASDLVSSFSGVGPQLIARFEEDVDALTVFFEEVIHVLCGDYNGDGFISQADLDLVLLNWGDTVLPAGLDPAALPGGTFDGLISQNELDKVLLNWGTGTPPSPVSAVPEPTAAAALAGLGLAACGGRRRRTRG